MPVATYNDVVTALGRPISSQTEIDQVNWWLGGIELVIKARLGAIASLDQDAVRFVEAEAVAEKVRRAGNTESSITVAVDDGSVTRRWDNQVSSADITDEWWNLLDTDSSRASSSIRPGFDVDDTRWPVATPPNPYGFGHTYPDDRLWTP